MLTTYIYLLQYIQAVLHVSPVKILLGTARKAYPASFNAFIACSINK